MTRKAPTRETRVADEFRDRLAWARLELARTVATTDQDLEAIAAHECREEAEEPATGTVGGLLTRVTGAAREQLAEIDAAQARLEAATFGTCETCRKPIPIARLRAKPTVRDCGDCAAAGRTRWPRLLGVVITVTALLVSAWVARGQGPSQVARGQSAFASNGCYGCHIVGKAGTPIGPELSHVGTKYSEEYLARWLRDPEQQRPGAHMPALELSDDDVRALAAYLASLR